MRAAHPHYADNTTPATGFEFAAGATPTPDHEAIAGFDAMLAGLDPDTARHALLDGIAEIALRQHQLRVRESRYASEDARPSELFRIG